MSSYKLILPGAYFLQTRLQSFDSAAIHAHIEWVPAILIISFWSPGTHFQHATQFFAGFFCFICFYEIGYFLNDYIASNKEEKPRKRLAPYKISKTFIVVFFSIRVCTFLTIAYTIFRSDSNFVIFYTLLGAVLFLHNTLSNPESKIATFLSLAMFRFYAPFFLFITIEIAIALLPTVLICYAFMRTLGYMDSKGLLIMPGRRSLTFKTNYYLLFSPLTIAISLLQSWWLPLLANVYFLTPWIVISAFARTRK